jgi:hypothetical protein
MSADTIRPSTLDGIKRYAKTLKAEHGVIHAKALDLAAVAGGFQNYTHARRRLEGADPKVPEHVAYISVPWRVRETKESGQEILAVRLRAPLKALVKPAHLTSARHFGTFKFVADDHLDHQNLVSSQSDARRRACAAARTLAFMEATGLRPSAGRSRAYPRGDFANAMPNKDHYSEWYHPPSKAYVFADEPYRRAVENLADERAAWAERHGWVIGRATWAGMYNPDGGCELYLAADKAKGFDLDAAIAALNVLPAPYVEAHWDGRSEPMFPPFASPAREAAVAIPKPPKPRGPRLPNATVGYRPMLARSERRRPAKRMPIEAHAEVGRLLKSVIADFPTKKRVSNGLGVVRCELDDWVQCEYSREELSNEVFFDLYYHEAVVLPDSLTGAARVARHLADLTEAKRLLSTHYADCAPVRALLKSIDKAMQALGA